MADVPRAPTSRLALAVLATAGAAALLALLGQGVLALATLGLAAVLALADAALHWLAVPRGLAGGADPHPIASAPTGYVKLSGRALPLDGLLTCPACGQECLWHGTGTGRDGGRVLASAVPFLLADSGGVCKVSPGPDGVDAPRGGGDHGHIRPGDVLTVRGWHEPVGYDLSVDGVDLPGLLEAGALSRVRQWRADPAMARVLDADRDGRLDQRELKAAAAAARAQVAREVARTGVTVRGTIRTPGIDDPRPFRLVAKPGPGGA